MKIWQKLGILSLSSVMIACTTINPYTGESQSSKAAKYGGAAAVVCGLIGAIESGKRARNAAAGCGAIGAGVGAYMDVQEAQLRQSLQGTGVSVAREGDNIRLVMPSNITFETDQSALRGDFYDVLNSVSLVLTKYPDTTMRVSGHTDSTGSDSYNMELSQRRAQSVSGYLSTQGVMNTRMFVEGRGETQPLADNGTPEGRAANRRVELYILPKT